MAHNPYAPPTAQVADISSDDELEQPAFFAVSPTKLFVMWVATFSFYQLYWFYKHWKLIKQREGSNILPALRAFFSIFFAYSLFKNFHGEAERYDVPGLPAAGVFAIVWVLLNLAGRLPGPLGFLPFLSIVVLLPAQVCANHVNSKVAPNHDPNSRFSALNWVGIIIGVGFIVLAVYGAMLPQQ